MNNISNYKIYDEILNKLYINLETLSTEDKLYLFKLDLRKKEHRVLLINANLYCNITHKDLYINCNFYSKLYLKFKYKPKYFIYNDKELKGVWDLDISHLSKNSSIKRYYNSQNILNDLKLYYYETIFDDIYNAYYKNI